MRNLKKPKPDHASLPRSSAIFQHFRSLGLISNHIPCAWQTRSGSDPSFHLITCIGNTFHIYDCAKITLLFVGPTFSEPILALCCRDNFTIVALSKEIVVCERAREISKIPFPSSDCCSSLGNPTQIECIGDFIYVAFEGKHFLIFDLAKGNLIAHLELEIICSYFIVPSGFSDKLLIAGTGGELQLWNFIKKKLIYSFSLEKRSNAFISTMKQSPAADVVALGFGNGDVCLLNFKLDKILFTLSHCSQHRISAISFRSDDNYPHLACSDDLGNVFLWNLQDRRLIYCIANAHHSSIHTCTFVGSSGILLTASSDNSIKQWHYDNNASDKPLLLKQRSGHREQPTCVEFYDGTEFKAILTGSRDRSFRLFSVENDALAVEISQKNSEFLLSPITQISTSTSKAKQWDNLLTCHEKEPFVCTWRYETKSIGDHKLFSSDKSPIKTCCISSCGNFALLGSLEGGIDIFNIQSGILRRSWRGHEKGISGLLMDQTNRKVISLSLDGSLAFWQMKDAKLLERVHLDSVPSMAISCPTNDLFAIACDDFSVRIWDFETQKPVRKFSQLGHSARITDLAFSPNGHWIVSSSIDCSIRTWDISTGTLIGIVDCSSIPVGIAFSPLGDFLVSIHSGWVGINVWSNMVHFSNSCYNSLEAHLKSLSIGAEGAENDAISQQACSSSSPDICFSSVSKAKWSMLFNLESIKMRNKPKNVSKPEAAPFFLGSAESFGKKSANEQESSSTEGQKMLDSSGMDNFTTLLLENADLNALSVYLKECCASLIDLHIRSLGTLDNFKELDAFLRFILNVSQSKKDFELVQAYLHVLLDEFGSLFLKEREHFAPMLLEIKKEISFGLESFESDLLMTQCLLDFHLKQ